MKQSKPLKKAEKKTLFKQVSLWRRHKAEMRRKEEARKLGKEFTTNA